MHVKTSPVSRKVLATAKLPLDNKMALSYPQGAADVSDLTPRSPTQLPQFLMNLTIISIYECRHLEKQTDY